MFIETQIIKKSLASLLTLAIFVSFQPVAKADTFKNVCASCHTGGMKGFLSGAPNISNKGDWQKYLKRDSVQEMRKIVLHGTKDHKPRGDCRTCTDQQIIEAIDYILSRVR